MTRIADQSSMTPWPWWVWALAAAFLVTVATIRAIQRAPLQPAEPSRLDTLDRFGRIGDQCRRSGHYYRLSADRTFYLCLNDGCDDTRARHASRDA